MVIDIKEDTLTVKAGRNTFLAGFVFVFGILIPFVFLNSSKALQTSENILVFTVYASVLAMSFIYPVISDFTQSHRKKSWTTILQSYIHNPNDGLFSILMGKDEPQTFKTFSKSVFIMIWFSILFSLIISFVYVANPTGSQFYKAPTTALDQLPVQSQLGQIYLAQGGSYSETLIFQASLMGLFFGLSLWLAKGNKALFTVYMILFLIIATAIFVVYHVARYGTTEIALVGVGALFVLTSLVMMFTGSIIFPLIFHSFLNQMWKAKILFATNEWILLSILGTIGTLFIISTLIYVLRKYIAKSPLINETTI